MSENIGEIAAIFLNFSDNMKIYHWQTTSYARHKASDQLVGNISDKMDRFIEVIQGCRGLRVKMSPQSLNLDNQSDMTALELLKKFQKWLQSGLPRYLQPEETDLFNIRDEILADVNQTLYLFSLQ